MKRMVCLLVGLLSSSLLINVGFVNAGEKTAEGSSEVPEVKLVLGNMLPKEGGVKSPDTNPLSSPFGVDFDSKGNMIIVELYGGRVHSLSPEGTLKQISGDGSKSYKGDGKPAAEATYNGMHNVAITPNDDIYIADSWNHCIRKIDAKTGIVSTILGTGKGGFSGDGGPALKAEFNFIMCISLNPDSTAIYIADLKNRRIRKMDLKTGIVSTVAGNGKRGVPADGAIATESPLVDPRAVAVDSHENIYILERGGHALRVVSPDGKISTVAGTGKGGQKDGPALSAQLNASKHLCVDPQDRVIIADDLSKAIRRYDPKLKTLTTILGHGRSNPAVFLSHPHGVCYENGKLYVVDTGNNRIFSMPYKP